MMTKLKPEIADHLLRQLPPRTKQALMDRFGISSNTLRKIEQGVPIRKSVAVRLQERLMPELAGGPEAGRAKDAR